MRFFRWLAGLLLVLVIALLAASWGLNAWIDSDGGRATLENQLSAAAGTPVRLSGELDVDLWPPVSASGTGLQIMDPVVSEPLAQSKTFSLELSLGALVKRQLRVERIRLEWLTLGAPGGNRFAVPAVEVTGFEAGKNTGVGVDLGFFGAISGFFTWWPEHASVDLDLNWAADQRDDIAVAGTVHYGGEVIGLEGLVARVMGQEISGQGCIVPEGPQVNLNLEADTLDLEALAAAIPGGEGGAAGRLPLDLNLRLEANTLYRGDMQATGAVLEFGAPPRCP